MKYIEKISRGLRRGARGARLCLGIVVTISSAACAPPPEPTHQTVEYYRANAEVRAARLAECANDPGALQSTPDCVNARAAERQESIGSFRDLPPMGLLPAKPETASNPVDRGAEAPDQGDEGEPARPR